MERSAGRSPSGVSNTAGSVRAAPGCGVEPTYILCTLGDPEPDEDVAALVAGGHWRLVEMDTGHWPTFSAPREPARTLLDTTAA